MQTIKEQSLKMIERLPADTSLETIMAELYFKLQVDTGLRELDEGKSLSHEEVMERMSKWLNA